MGKRGVTESLQGHSFSTNLYADPLHIEELQDPKITEDLLLGNLVVTTSVDADQVATLHEAHGVLVPWRWRLAYSARLDDLKAYLFKVLIIIDHEDKQCVGCLLVRLLASKQVKAFVLN